MLSRLSFYLLCLSGSALAADMPGSQDLEVLPRAARSEIVDYQDVASLERRYPLGAVQRISSQLRLEREVLAEGRLRALTYRLPDEHPPREALAAARHALLEQGAQLLYWCEGRECGSSSLWANNIFDNAKLYGPEERQSYLLLRLVAPQQDSLLALYGITRGNRRSYLHAEQLDASTPLPAVLPVAATLLRQLREHGELALPHLSAPDQIWSELLGRTLNLDSTLRVSLSGASAAAWIKALQEQGVRATRLELGMATADGLLLQQLR
ncbi:DUF4892 domain-containing protein [Pseudomonas sp. J452]|uniref:DUF4892 domain-containing protein n=1 Tax=Pseudomonas sp. J452 TaxID=2898441 RepID=UPI0021ADD7FC|nr:DUF4892 domain-containing protein [Pseudomonas sp. J452]UUY07563.1 DUF4892 domain-containing protein [Pseudomonas sp. J452]